MSEKTAQTIAIQDEEQYRGKRKDAELARNQYLSDLGKVVNTPEGRRVLKHIVGVYGRVYQISFHADSERQSAFQEGRRSMALTVLKDITLVDPKVISEILIDQTKP